MTIGVHNILINKIFAKRKENVWLGKRRNKTQKHNRYGLEQSIYKIASVRKEPKLNLQFYIKIVTMTTSTVR